MPGKRGTAAVRPGRLLVMILATGALLVAGWLSLPWLQVKRADAMLVAANGHIDEANRLMATTDLASLDPASFSSEAAIADTLPRLDTARENLGRAQAELDAAAADVDGAARLVRLPAEYRHYLQKKAETAALRKQQAATLIEATARLRALYDSGAAVFAAVQETDRLTGRLTASLQEAQNRPVDAGQTLAEVEESAARLSQQLENEYERTGFELSANLAAALRQYEELAGLGRKLAAAAAAGDQGTAQQLGAEIEQGRYSLTSGTGQLGAWWEGQITPLMDEFNALQVQMEELDGEASGIYGNF